MGEMVDEDPLLSGESITETLIARYKEARNAQGENGDNLADNDAFHVFDESQKSGFWEFTKSWLESGASALGLSTSSDFTLKERIENLLIQKKTATSYRSWLQISTKLDELQKFNRWKEQKESTLYDYKLIEKNLNDLKQAREAGDIKKLLYLIRTTWVRNIGNIGNVNLYRHSHTGTKKLIEDYLEQCHLALKEVTRENAENGVDDRYTLAMLLQTRKNIGRTALVLSGGGCFGLFHIGVLAAMLEENSLPRIISGSSAGAIVASILCVHNNDEITELIKTIVEKKFDIFDSPDSKDSILICLSRFLKFGTWYDNSNLQKTMIDFLGDLTFREAYYRTGKILNITVSPASVHEHPRLLNYLTAPSVLIWSAVCASCSLPGIFPSSTIYEKNSRTGETQEWHHTSVKFVDGSVDNDLPVARLSEMFNVDHIIACQVNPHVVPFLKLSVTCVGGEIETEYSARFKTKLGQFYEMFSSEVTHYLQMLAEVGVSRNLCTKLRSVLSQQYSGDITILPDLKEISQLSKLLANPTPEYLLHCTMKGARATWPKISIIRNHCGLEFELDNAIKLLKGRDFKNSNPNLALVNYSSKTTERSKISKTVSSIGKPPLSPRSAKRQSVIDSTHNNHKHNNQPHHHNRHRSETMSVANLKTLRSVKSNLSVNLPDPQFNVQSRYQPQTTRYHRSYSANEDSNYHGFGYLHHSLPASEATSPLIHSNNTNQESYFQKPTRSSGSGTPSRTNSFRASPGYKPSLLSNQNLYKKASNGAFPTINNNNNNQGIQSNSSSSEKLFISPQKKQYNNIDNLDGLFTSSESPEPHDELEDYENDSSMSVDPVKVDDMNSGSDLE